MTALNINPTSVRNKILDAIQYRLKGVVKNVQVYFNHLDTRSSNMPSATPGGTYVGDPRSFQFDVTGISEITYKEVFKDGFEFGSDTTLSVTDGDNIVVADTGMTILINFTGDLTIGDTFEVFYANYTDSIRECYRWERIFTNTQTPSIVIFPQKETKEAVVSDKFDCTLNVALTLWVDSVPEGYLYFEELLADVIDRFHSNEQFGQCFNYDSEIVEVQIDNADGVSNKIGAYLEANIHYRHAVRDTRAAKN
tara:strand:- start:4337 stop:5092 length:756 start_codon:yes stop_codon:yes gene_type:complete